MFTGIITATGEVAAIEKSGDWRFRIAAPWDCAAIDLGASIACSGVCLTVIARDSTSFDVEASAETLGLTTLGSWQTGSHVNLERALKMGDELGGHIVSGHVDGLAELVEMRKEGASHRLVLACPDGMKAYVARKGSVALDGISLTVNEVDDNHFGVNIIAHTWQETTLSERRIGDKLNFEADMLARYVARLADVKKAG